MTAIQKAWDHLDAGLKQWIINGISMAVSFIPIAGPLISCIIDGTFVDMWNAIKAGDWAMLAMRRNPDHTLRGSANDSGFGPFVAGTKSRVD
jgi:hypothetical protein